MKIGWSGLRRRAASISYSNGVIQDGYHGLRSAERGPFGTGAGAAALPPALPGRRILARRIKAGGQLMVPLA